MSDAGKLRRAYRLLDHVHDLSPGQIVTWKPGLKNRDQPELSEPLVVLELLDEPLHDDTATCDCAAAWERPDVIGGWLDDEEQLAVGCFDRRRLQPHIVIETAAEDS
jgi:hypothetical protein